MKKKRRNIFASILNDEEREWLKLSPAKRFLETTKLWKLYRSLGGSLDPEPDPQSPFNHLYYPIERKTGQRNKTISPAQKN